MATTVYVVPEGDHWVVRRDLTAPDLAICVLEIQAIATAAGIARREGGSVMICDGDGNMRRYLRRAT